MLRRTFELQPPELRKIKNMGLKLSKLCEAGYEAQAMKLAHKLKENHRTSQYKQAAEWSAIPGIRINDSFFDVTDKNHFSPHEIDVALCQLGVNTILCKGKKWYQFWLNNGDVKLFNAVKSIPL